jgi:hypothetical protein
MGSMRTWYRLSAISDFASEKPDLLPLLDTFRVSFDMLVFVWVGSLAFRPPRKMIFYFFSITVIFHLTRNIPKVIKSHSLNRSIFGNSARKLMGNSINYWFIVMEGHPICHY